MSYGNLLNDTSQRRALEALLAGTAPLPPGSLGPGSVPRSVAEKLGETVSVKDFGAVGDSITDDTEAFTAAFAVSTRVFVPSGTYLISSQVDVPEGSTLSGVYGQSVLYGTMTGAIFRAFARTSFFGLKFTGSGSAYGITNSVLTTNRSVTVENCWFAIDRGIYIQPQTSNATESDWKIRHNYFESFSYALYIIRLNRSTIEDNTFYASGTTERAIFFNAGYGNRIVHNDIEGGKAAVMFLNDYSLNASKAVVVGNVVAFNTIRGCTEESIAFDCHGNSGSDNSAREYTTVSAKSSSSPIYFVTLAGDWSATGTDYIGAYMCFMTGALKGKAARILDHTENQGKFNMLLTTPDYTAVQVGDVISLGTPFLRNIVIGNNITLPEGYVNSIGISFWGYGFENTIVGNTITHWHRSADQFGIRLASLNGLDSDGYLGELGRAPCMGNVVSANVLSGCGIRFYYYNYGGDADYTSYGNRAEANIIHGGRLELVRQENLAYRSEGHEASVFSNSTAAPIAFTAKQRTAPLHYWRSPTSQNTTLGNAASSGLCGLAATASTGLLGVATNNTSSTESAQLSIEIPGDYIAGEAISFNVRGRVGGTRQVTQTIGLTVKKWGDNALGSDICATSAQTVTTSYADYAFSITPTSLSPGDFLQIVLTMTNNDTGGSVGSQPISATKTWLTYTAR